MRAPSVARNGTSATARALLDPVSMPAHRHGGAVRCQLGRGAAAEERSLLVVRARARVDGGARRNLRCASLSVAPVRSAAARPTPPRGYRSGVRTRAARRPCRVVALAASLLLALGAAEVVLRLAGVHAVRAAAAIANEPLVHVPDDVRGWRADPAAT